MNYMSNIDIVTEKIYPYIDGDLLSLCVRERNKNLFTLYNIPLNCNSDYMLMYKDILVKSILSKQAKIEELIGADNLHKLEDKLKLIGVFE